MSRESHKEGVDDRIYEAVRTRRLEELAELLKGGAPQGYRGPTGRSALGLAVSEGQSEMVRMLLDGGADPNAQIMGEDSALALAASFGSGELCKMLLDAGADPNGKNAKGATALHCAAGAAMEVEGIKRLIQRGADAGAAYGPGRWTPLHAACSAFWIDDEGPRAALALIAGGASVLARASQNGEELTAAQMAARRGNEEMARALEPLERAELERKALESEVTLGSLKERADRWRAERESAEADELKPAEAKARRGL